MPNPVLKLDARSADVARLQTALASLGYHVEVDGYFGPKTKFAVLAFQADRGLKADGVVGAATWAVLLSSVPAEMPAAELVDGTITDADLDAFEAAMVDRRAEHSPLVKDSVTKKMRPYEPAARAWSETTGVTLHQTACDMGERVARYDTIGAHFAVLRSGRVLRMADLNTVVYHGNRWNARTVGIEVNGLYSGLEDDPDTAQDEALRTTWDDPSTPTRELPMQVTPQAMRATRMLVRWIAREVARNGGALKYLVAHRQSSMDRRNDPGEAIWTQVALPLHAELGLGDGGVGFKVGGYAIPHEWDARCEGFDY